MKQRAIITLTDNDDGTLGVSMEFEPGVPDNTKSHAVHFALFLMDRLTEKIRSKEI
jgi:hypothetical protein